jgi:hypothetical protein
MLLLAAILVVAAPSADIETFVALGIPRERAVVPFAVTPEISKAARELVDKRSRDSAAVSTRARAIYDGLRALIAGGVIVSERDNRPKARAPFTAAELWAHAKNDDKPRVGCYELTALYIAMARSQGINAVGVTPTTIAGTGETGHVLAVVIDAKGNRTRVDLQNGGFMRDHNTRELTDFDLTAHFYNLRGVGAMVANDPPEEAAAAFRDGLRLSDHVAELDANFAILEMVRGNKESALKRATHAAALEPNVPYFQYNEGVVAIEVGQYCQGLTALRRALHLLPSYEAARRLARETLDKHEDLRCP